MEKLSLLCLLLLCSFMLSPASARAESDTFDIWMYNAYHREVIVNKSTQYFDVMLKPFVQDYELLIDRDVNALIEACKLQPPGLIIAPQIVTQLVQKHCDYRPVLQTHAKNHLMGLNHSQANTLKSMQRVGYISIMSTEPAGSAELRQLNSDIKLIGFTNLFELTQKIDSENLDGVLLNGVALQLIAPISKSWQLVYDFKEESVALMLASGTLDDELVAKLVNRFLSVRDENAKPRTERFHWEKLTSSKQQ